MTRERHQDSITKIDLFDTTGGVIMAKLTLKEVVKRLSESSTNISCEEMRKLLEDLGFKVRKGKNGNHHTFSHPEISSFHGGNYDCGHGSKMKPVYPRNVAAILNRLEDDIEGNDDKA